MSNFRKCKKCKVQTIKERTIRIRPDGNDMTFYCIDCLK